VIEVKTKKIHRTDAESTERAGKAIFMKLLIPSAAANSESFNWVSALSASDINRLAAAGESISPRARKKDVRARVF
jgi:hypothetical protein